ncbi:MAG: excinuclease ABC subunit UvrA [Planctomycetaceae bacterium]
MARTQLPSRDQRELDEISRQITIRGARQHNLQDVDLIIPRNKINVFAGPSGSGKTSLAMDTLYAEGQRRYVESLSSYARQFLGQMPKPKVTQIQGLSPSIAIEQKTVGSTPRSTVGTVTEIYDYLRVLYARLGQLYCPKCERPVTRQTVDEIVEQVLRFPKNTRVLLLSAIALPAGDTYADLWDSMKKQGYSRVRVDGITHHLDAPPRLDYKSHHHVEVVIDRLTIRSSKAERSRIAESLELALSVGKGHISLAIVDADRAETEWEQHAFSVHLSCRECGRGFEHLTPQNFSFNSPLGWCGVCEGLGVEQGVRQTALIADSSLTLREGAIAVWPNPQVNPRFCEYLEGLSQALEIPLDVPFARLTARQQNILYHGGEQPVPVPGQPGLTIVYRGLLPALREAPRLSYDIRRGLIDQLGEQHCSHCQGTRLREDAAHVRFQELTLPQLCNLPLVDALEALQGLKLDAAQQRIAGDLVSEATHRLKFLVDVGLDYLSLDRGMPTLSGGESQRIRLAGQLGRALTGVLYVLDEPTIGLHPRDNHRLVTALQQLRDLGNTVLLVEHDRDVIEQSDRIYDFGPAAGRLGGHVVAQGSPGEIQRNELSLTGNYLSGRQTIPVPARRRIGTVAEESEETPRKSRKRKAEQEAQLQTQPRWIELHGVRHHNLRNIDFRIPRGAMTCVTGVSGSGKSSLVMDTLAEAARKQIHFSGNQPGLHSELTGLNGLRKVVVVDQQPLGNTPASCPATYVGFFDHVRELFTQLPEAKKRGYRAGRFSFNIAGGRCEECQGLGQLCIEMHFLPDVWVECPTCRGERFNAETLQVRFQGHSIADVLKLSVQQAADLFANIPRIHASLRVLCEIGLDYLTLGQSAPTLSGGESQRIKLAAELARPNQGSTLYILDEPTTGLHMDDISKLLKVLNGLIDLGNTVVIVEHNLDVIKTADWVVDIGPEAGRGGGWIVAEGTPEEIVAEATRLRDHVEFLDTAGRHRKRSWTGELLEPVLKLSKRQDRETLSVQELKEAPKPALANTLSQNLPWQKEGLEWHLGQGALKNKRGICWEPSLLRSLIELLEGYGLMLDPGHQSMIAICCPRGWHPEFIASLQEPDYSVAGRIHTSMKHALGLELCCPFDATDLLDEDEDDLFCLTKRTSHLDWLGYELTSRRDLDNRLLRRLLDELFGDFT